MAKITQKAQLRVVTFLVLPFIQSHQHTENEIHLLTKNKTLVLLFYETKPQYK